MKKLVTMPMVLVMGAVANAGHYEVDVTYGGLVPYKEKSGSGEYVYVNSASGITITDSNDPSHATGTTGNDLKVSAGEGEGEARANQSISMTFTWTWHRDEPGDNPPPPGYAGTLYWEATSMLLLGDSNADANGFDTDEDWSLVSDSYALLLLADTCVALADCGAAGGVSDSSPWAGAEPDRYDSGEDWWDWETPIETEDANESLIDVQARQLTYSYMDDEYEIEGLGGQSFSITFWVYMQTYAFHSPTEANDTGECTSEARGELTVDARFSPYI